MNDNPTATLTYWYAPTYEGGFGGVYSKTEKDCLDQINALTAKGGKFGLHCKIEIEYVDAFDLMMHLFGYTPQEDGRYRPGVKMVGRQ